MQPTVRPHRHTCEVVKNYKASKLSTQTQSTKNCRWYLKQNKAMQYHLFMTVLAECSSSFSDILDISCCICIYIY